MASQNGIQMIVDATITIGNIIEIATIAGGGLIAMVTVRNSVFNLRNEFKNMQGDFIDMKKDIRALGEVMVKMAVTDQRLLGVEQDVRELKHGRGFVQHEVQGEWPRS